MKKKISVFLSAVLLLAMLFPFAVSAQPSETSINGYVATNGNIEETENGVEFTVTASGAKLYCPIESSNIFDGANTLALVLSNSSAVELVDVDLIYADGNVIPSKLEISKYSSRATYTLLADNCTGLRGVELDFGAVSSGKIVVGSVSAVSTFDEKTDHIGEVSECSYSSKTVIIKGSLRHNSDSKHSTSKINVYALSPRDTVEDILSGKLEPVIKDGAMAIRFEFSIPADSVEDRLKRYAVAVVGDDGIELVDIPVYPNVSVPESGHGFKGIETSGVSDAINVGSDLTVLRVETDQLMSKDKNGYMYTADSVRYFFDRDFIAELDRKVKMLDGAGGEVYLRIAGFEELYAKDGQLGAYATVRFLCDRYSSSEYGRISGIIMGECTNEKLAGRTLAQSVKDSYDALYSVFAAANDAKNPVNAVLSVSDSWGQSPKADSVSADLFLEALFSVCGYFSESRFSVMTEISSNPYSLNNAYIESLGSKDENNAKQGEVRLQKANKENGCITAENIKAFFAAINSLCDKYMDERPALICAWSPEKSTSGSALTASYIYDYYSSFASGLASAFIVCLPVGEGNELSLMGELRYVMKKIDTKDAGVSDFAKDIFGISDWKDEMGGFDVSKVESGVLLDSLAINTEMPRDVLGKYAYWNFGTQTAGGWYAGAGCSGVSIENTKTDGRSLTARFSSDETVFGEYSFFAYKYEDGESFKYNDYLIFDLVISADTGRDFEVNISLGGDGFAYEYKTTELRAGKRYTVCIELDGVTASSPVEYIRICSKDLNANPDAYSLSIYSISAASRKYSDAELAKLIEEEREIKEEQKSPQEKPKAFWVVIIVATVLLTGAAMIMVGKNKKNTRPEDRV